MKVRFLLDENLPPRLRLALQRLNSGIDVLCVGDPGAPALGTLDPDILDYSHRTGRLLVTDNRKSMPGHIEVFLAAGRHYAGVIWLRPNARWNRIIEDLHLIWDVSEASEWIDRTEWLPF